MDKTHVPYPGCYCADCVEGTTPIGYINAEMLNRKIEFEANGMVMFDRPCGAATMPLYAEPPSARITGDKDRENPAMDNVQVSQEARRNAQALLRKIDCMGGESDEAEVVQAFAKFERDTLARHRQQAERGEVVARYRHKKRGTVYEIIGEAELQMNFDCLVDGSEMVVYRGEDGKLWVREYGEFHDGRFEALPTPPEAA